MLRDRVSEVGRHCQILRKRPIDGRRRQKHHVGTEVVAPPLAVLAVPTRDAWLDGNSLADARPRHRGTNGDDLPRRLMAQNQWLIDDITPDAAVLVVVHVRAAYADGADADQDLVGGR